MKIYIHIISIIALMMKYPLILAITCGENKICIRGEISIVGCDIDQKCPPDMNKCCLNNELPIEMSLPHIKQNTINVIKDLDDNMQIMVWNKIRMTYSKINLRIITDAQLFEDDNPLAILGHSSLSRLGFPKMSLKGTINLLYKFLIGTINHNTDKIILLLMCNKDFEENSIDSTFFTSFYTNCDRSSKIKILMMRPNDMMATPWTFKRFFDNIALNAIGYSFLGYDPVDSARILSKRHATEVDNNMICVTPSLNLQMINELLVSELRKSVETRNSQVMTMIKEIMKSKTMINGWANEPLDLRTIEVITRMKIINEESLTDNAKLKIRK